MICGVPVPTGNGWVPTCFDLSGMITLNRSVHGRQIPVFIPVLLHQSWIIDCTEEEVSGMDGMGQFLNWGASYEWGDALMPGMDVAVPIPELRCYGTVIYDCTWAEVTDVNEAVPELRCQVWMGLYLSWGARYGWGLYLSWGARYGWGCMSWGASYGWGLYLSWGARVWMGTVPELRCQVWMGLAMVCLPIWHWYMLRGDWLKSGRGMVQARLERKLVGRISLWVVSPGLASDSLMHTSR